mmetsp:Transcript_29781/g.45664  ORF Transcript_29781/g.45664 Transcript_29781/m.45664 type:complete len:333 (+) Transcript_29781:225-1223(+)|eukprot:CAMPEP_0195307018 /NCGR_PEP_ID=MMETSP0707-20130614/37501_1 /TAXON_ID=33640 /ORGANISM="Asterionellopsis glacialis, Strain CCMP134" /LENGTH=332 /DNA_ID=CAMNT_0040371255 /DNA_START=121 /DNA_END=1119 /DNA_ORIENTATION=+
MTLCGQWLLFLLCTFLSNECAQAFTLITFDVDGTLVRGSGQAADTGAHATSISIACGKVLGDGSPTIPVAEALERRDFHGSTDGLILLRLAKAALGVDAATSYERLDDMMQEMYQNIASLTDEELMRGIDILPGVISHLKTLSTMKDQVACGLVTGNVEGIARRKMRAVGVWDTGALAPPSSCQQSQQWPGVEGIGFLGGFGSDYCSGNIDDFARNHLDRAEQIAIATKRCQAQLLDQEEERGQQSQKLQRVVHVGDAPADVLAAKAFALNEIGGKEIGDGICVGMVAVATGSYSAEELRELAGEPIPGCWEPVILNDGMADPTFLKACGVV